MSNEPKQTAVEWLFQVIPFRLFLTEQGIAVIKAQALQIEQEQIEEARQGGYEQGQENDSLGRY